MADAPSKTPTWIYNAKGESQLIELGDGEAAPKGWAFAPPSGVEVKVDDIEPPPPSPLSSLPAVAPEQVAGLEARIATLEEKLQTVEAQMVEIGEFLEAMTAPATPEPAKVDDKAILVARAKELGIENVTARWSVETLKNAIAEAEAKAAGASGGATDV